MPAALPPKVMRLVEMGFSKEQAATALAEVDRSTITVYYLLLTAFYFLLSTVYFLLSTFYPTRRGGWLCRDCCALGY